MQYKCQRCGCYDKADTTVRGEYLDWLGKYEHANPDNCIRSLQKEITKIKKEQVELISKAVKNALINVE